jgi:hypothetical protein
MSGDMNAPDCLVLKIEEYDDECHDNITNIYVLYDHKMGKFILRGSYISTKMYSAPYSFMADTPDDVCEFILFAMDKENKKNIVLYNYDNLPESSYDITYEFLRDWQSQEYEIVGYNRAKPNKKYLVNCLRILRNMYNPMY